jgi:hypothetical protein
MRTRGAAAWAATSAAIALSVLLLVAAVVLPVYEAFPESDRTTLVEVNGAGVLLPVAVPLLLSVIAWLGLRRKCATGSRRGERYAFWALVLLFAFAIISGFSIGVAVSPIAVLVAIGFTLAPRGPRQA